LLTVVAVVAMYACSLAAARQSSTGDTAATKPATTTSNAQSHSTASGKSSFPSSSAGAQKSTGKPHTASVGKRPSRKKSARVRGQQKIDSERAQAIQEALIREHYLSGEATGTWNQSSEEAMRRYQADNGWQSKTVPDARALIKLGLARARTIC